jgi:copper chaperone
VAVEAPHHTQVTVIGMTCQHCVMSVTEEVGEIEGVQSVDVQLATGAVTVVSERAIDLGEIAAAVEEAGFALAS